MNNKNNSNKFSYSKNYFNFRKSQTATEYLIILAVVIVIALIVIGVLGEFPTLGTGASESAARASLASQDVGITNYAITPVSVFLKVKNNQPGTISITAIEVGGQTCTLEKSNYLLKAGQSQNIICANVSTEDVGQKVNTGLSINWTDVTKDAKYQQNKPDTKLVGNVNPPSSTLLTQGEHNVSGEVIYKTPSGLVWSTTMGPANAAGATSGCLDLVHGGISDWSLGDCPVAGGCPIENDFYPNACGDSGDCSEADSWDPANQATNQYWTSYSPSGGIRTAYEMDGGYNSDYVDSANLHYRCVSGSSLTPYYVS